MRLRTIALAALLLVAALVLWLWPHAQSDEAPSNSPAHALTGSAPAAPVVTALAADAGEEEEETGEAEEDAGVLTVQVEGRVTSAGRPLGEARVFCGDASTFTNPSGEYALSIPAQIGSLSAQKPGFMSEWRDVQPRPGETLHVDFDLSPSAEFELEGWCDGERVGILFMTVIGPDGGHVSHTSGRREQYWAPPGRYTVELMGPAGGKACKGKGTLEVVSAVPPKKHRFELTKTSEPMEFKREQHPGRTASLRLTTTPPYRPSLRPGEAMSLITLTGPGEQRMARELPVTMELEPGRWHVKAITPVGLAEADVELRAGEQTPLELELKPSGHRVSGRLVDARTQGPPPLGRTHLDAIYPYEPEMRTVTPDVSTDGRFVFRQLPDGRLALLVQTEGYARLLVPLTLDRDIDLGVVSLTPGKTGTVKLEPLGVRTSMAPGGGLRIDIGGAGLEPGDVIVAYQNIDLRPLKEDLEAASAGPLAEPCVATIERRGAKVTLSLPRRE